MDSEPISRRGSIARERRTSLALERTRSQSIAPDATKSNGPGSPVGGDGISFPVQLTFNSGDAIGVQRAFHNSDAELAKAKGIQHASHTVVALEPTISMNFDSPAHIAIFKKGFDRSLKEKVEVLATVPNYTQCTRDCLVEMAKFTRRVWHPPGELLIRQGDKAQDIYYIVAGMVQVVKDMNTSNEKVLNVIGPGSCFGDWGVVNNKLRGASCVTSCDTELLLINDFNFKATVDQALLLELVESATEVDALNKSTTDHSEKSIDVEMRRVQKEKAAKTAASGQKTVSSFQLISRKDKKEAGMRISRDTESEDRQTLPTVHEMEHRGNKISAGL
jgi:CRP-like cAMP-binding protein